MLFFHVVHYLDVPRRFKWYGFSVSEREKCLRKSKKASELCVWEIERERERERMRKSMKRVSWEREIGRSFQYEKCKCQMTLICFRSEAVWPQVCLAFRHPRITKKNTSTKPHHRTLPALLSLRNALAILFNIALRRTQLESVVGDLSIHTNYNVRASSVLPFAAEFWV